MPYSDFIQVRGMEGELLLSQKRNRFGCMLTTKELIFQKPHVTYKVMLSDTLGIVPYHVNPPVPKPDWMSGIQVNLTTSFYRISASRIFVINRQGRFQRGATDLLVPLSERFLRQIQQHTDLTFIPTS